MDYNNIPNNYQNQYTEKKPANGLAIASMVLGILSILFALCYGVGIIFGIVSIIFGILSKKNNGGKLSGMALAGIICSICGIIIGIVYIILIIVGFSILSDASQSQGYDNIFDYINSNSFLEDFY